jgi:3-oxoacyl-[acyl-carrier protein] reductase
VKFSGCTAVVIGGGGSIGGAICRELAHNGAAVAVCDYALEAAEEVAAQAGNGSKAYAVNVRDYAGIEQLKASVLEEYGRADIFIYAAGGSARGDIAPLPVIKPEVIENVIGVNLLGAIYSTRAFLDSMIAQKSGKIIYIASIVGVNGMAKLSEYAAAKGGVIAMAKSLAKELGPHGINVNCVSPGLVPRPEQMMPETLDSMKARSYIGKVTMPEDIAKLTAFLASADGDLVTGQNYIMDGGRSLANKGDQ